MSMDPIASSLAAGGVAYAPEIAGADRRHGLDPALLAAVAAQETGGPDTNAGRNVVGDGGHGRGLFQIDDRWHTFAATPAAMDPAKNADYAAGMISGLLSRYGGNVREALSAYNAGSPNAEGTRTRWSDGSDLGYADSVLRHYERIGGAAPASTAAAALAPAAMPAAVPAFEPSGATFAQLPMLSMPAPAHEHAFHRQATDYANLLNDTNESSLVEQETTP